MLNQASLSYWLTNTYNAEKIDVVFNSSPHYLRLVKVSWDGSGALMANVTPNVDTRHYLYLMDWIKHTFLLRQPKNKGSFLVSVHDAVWEKISEEVPILSFGKSKNDNNTVLIPDLHFTSTFGYKEERETMAYINQSMPWEDRLPAAFWRGATTGSPAIAPDNWRNNSRVRLCLRAKEIADPSMLDASFSEVIQCNFPEVETQIKAAGLLSERVAYPTFARWRYQIDIDGNSCSWGLLWKLMMNSVVFKVGSTHEQWYYHYLKPFEHYIPVKSDLSDLEEKILWARENDSQCQQIAKNAQQLASSISYENCARDFSLLIERLLSAGQGQEQTVHQQLAS